MNGLVIAGGKSSRMQTNKAFIQYHGTTQIQFIFDLISPFCEETFISFNSHNPTVKLPQIIDLQSYQNIGPIAALASAFAYKKTDWLIVAIDYPLINSTHIKLAVKLFLETKKTSVMYNAESKLFEPFIGIYKSTFEENLNSNIIENNYSLQSILQELDIEKIQIENTILQSIDNPIQYKNIISTLKK